MRAAAGIVAHSALAFELPPELEDFEPSEALAGLKHLKVTYKVTYEEALQQFYLWHEFGDLQ